MKLNENKYFEFAKSYLGDQKWKYGLLTILMLISTFLEVLSPQIISKLIDGILGTMTLHRVIQLVFFFFGIILLSEVARIVVTYVGNKISWNAMIRLRKNMLSHCLNQEETFHYKHKTGELIDMIDGDVSILFNFFSSLLILIIYNAISIVGILIMIFRENVMIGLVELVFIMIVFYVFGKIQHMAVPYWKKERTHSSSFYNLLNEGIEGKEDFKANGSINYIQGLFTSNLTSWRKNHIKANVMGTLSYAIYLVIIAISYSIIFGFGTYLWKRGLITVGTIYLLFNYNQNLFLPIQRIRRQFDDLQKVSASIQRIQGVLKDGKDLKEEKKEGYVAEGPIDIKVEDLCFSYVQGTDVLKNISFDLPREKNLVILGRTGSGKTTLARLFMQIYEHQEGFIYMNGTNINEISLHNLREHISYVTQEVQIFNATLRDNITFFDHTIQDSAIIQTFHSLGLMEWFEQLENGLDTMISEHSLSNGQAQFIAFARVFFKNSKVVILDEATSNVDSLTEKLMGTAIRNLLEGRTAIIIAHRLSTLQYADDVLILENGNIVEYGAYKVLKQDSNSVLSTLLCNDVNEVFA